MARAPCLYDLSAPRSAPIRIGPRNFARSLRDRALIRDQWAASRMHAGLAEFSNSVQLDFVNHHGLGMFKGDASGHRGCWINVQRSKYYVVASCLDRTVGS